MDSKLYDKLKAIALVWLPVLGSAYFALAPIWNLPDVAQVVGSITALDTVLGGAVHISNKVYTPPDKVVDGNIVVDPAKKQIMLDPITDPDEMLTMKKGQVLTFKVVEKS